MYLIGEGVAKDPATARTWFEKAAATGDPAAEYARGHFYIDGVGAPVDPVRALSWFQRSAAHGYPTGPIVLASCIMTDVACRWTLSPPTSGC